MEKEPINDRAWTLQEHVISPRVLYYSFHQLHWICRSGIRADGGFCPTDRDTPWKGGSIYRIFSLSQTTTDMIEPSISAALAQPDKYASWPRNWGHQLEYYQTQCLTNQDDKLVAVSSAGELFARYMDTELIAGLFERDLALNLLWGWIDGAEALPRGRGPPSTARRRTGSRPMPCGRQTISQWRYFRGQANSLLHLKLGLVGFHCVAVK